MARNPRDRPPCFTGCGRPAIDSHHIFPVEYGGARTGPQVDLCESCHGEVHRLASAAWKPGKSAGVLAGIANGVIRTLVEGILKQRAEFARTGIAPEARRRIVAELSVEEQQSVRLIKNHFGYTSQEAMLKGIISKLAELIKAGKL